MEFRACLASTSRCLWSQNINKYSNKPTKGRERIIRRFREDLDTLAPKKLHFKSLIKFSIKSKTILKRTTFKDSSDIFKKIKKCKLPKETRMSWIALFLKKIPYCAGGELCWLFFELLRIFWCMDSYYCFSTIVNAFVEDLLWSMGF